MASCIIQRNSDRGISRATTRDGVRSTLFDKIAGLPVLEDIEKAVSAYKYVYSNEFKKFFGDWERRVPKNSENVRAIAQALGDADPTMRERTVAAARQMELPILVSRSSKYSTDTHPVYTTDLDNINDSLLLDAYPAKQIDTTGISIPENANAREYILGLAEQSPMPVMDLLMSDGTHAYIISDVYPVIPISELPAADADNNLLTYANGEPRLFFHDDDGYLYTDYGTALRNSNSPYIYAGFVSGTVAVSDGNITSDVDVLYYDDKIFLNNPNAFQEVITINTDTNISNELGAINRLVKKGILSGERMRYDGKYYLVGAGNLPSTKAFNSAVAYSELFNQFSGKRVTMDEGGRISIEPEEAEVVSLVSTGGQSISMSPESFKRLIGEGRYNELANKYTNLSTVFISEFLKSTPVLTRRDLRMIENAQRENMRIRNGIISILTSLGIRVIGMEDYAANYKTKNGIEPNARAWADVANSVIALTEDATDADLIEEAAHFMIETYKDQARVDEVAPLVRGTELWNEYADTYYQIYGREYQGEELDRMVEREILGKMLMQQFLDMTPGEVGSVEEGADGILEDYIGRARSFFGSQRQQLDELLNDLANLALTEDLSAFNTSLLDSNTHIYYSAEAIHINNVLSSYRSRLEAQLRNFRAIQSNLSYSAKKNLETLRENMETVQDQLNGANTLISLNSVVSTAEGQVRFLNAITKDYIKSASDGKFDMAMYQNMANITDIMVPIIKELRGVINTGINEISAAEKQRLLDRIDRIILESARVESDIKSVRSRDEEGFFKKLFDYLGNPTDEQKEALKTDFKKSISDVLMMTRWFGSLSQSSVPMLRWLAKLVSISNAKTRINTQKDLGKFFKAANEGKWTRGDYQRIRQSKNSNYLDSAIDMDKADAMEFQAQVEAIVDIYGLREGYDKNKKEFLEKAKEGIEVKDINTQGEEVTFTLHPGKHISTLNMSLSNERAYSDKMDAFYKEYGERRYSDAYYKLIDEVDAEIEKRLGRKITDQTKLLKQGWGHERELILSKYRENGRVNWRKLYSNATDYQSYLEITKRKKQAKSMIGEDGEYRQPGSVDYMVAQDLQVYDTVWREVMEREGLDKGQLTSDFYSQLQEAEKDGHMAAYEFVAAGGRMAFSREFWDAYFGTDERSNQDGGIYRPVFQEILKEDPNAIDEINSIIIRQQKARERLSGILKQNRISSQPGEINYDGLSGQEIESVKECVEELRDISRSIRKLAKSHNIEIEGDDTIAVENELNESYYQALADHGGSEIDFCKEHMLPSDVRTLETLEYHLNRLLSGKEVTFSKYEKELIAKKVNTSAVGMAFNERVKRNWKPEYKDEILKDYVRSHVMPYFKRFAPKGYTDFINRIKSGEINVRQLVEDKQNGTYSQDYGFNIDYLQFDIASDWYDQGRLSDRPEYINPNYDPNSEYGRFQPKRDKFLNQAYLDKYGIQYDANGKEKATKNLKDYNMIQTLKDLKKEGLKRMGITSGYNIYELPQITKQGIERFGQLITKPGDAIENFMREIATNREDEMLYGQTVEGGSQEAEADRQWAIPRYYLRRLSNPSDLSDDLLYSYAMFTYQANNYENKKDSIDMAMELEQRLLESRFEGGKTPVRSNAYKQFKDFMNYHYYGAKMSRNALNVSIGGFTIDMSKIMMMVNKTMSMMNLAFSPFVAATSAITGQVTSLVESRVGQYVSSGSWVYAKKEVARLIPKYATEVGNFDKKSKLYVMGEAMGIYGLTGRSSFGGYSRGVRNLSKAINPYAMMEVANAPIAPEVMISILDDTRFYDGRFIRFNEYKKLTNKKGSDLKTSWDQLKSKSLYSMMDVSDGQLIYKPQPGISEEMIKSRLELSTGEIKNLRQICEGMLSEEDRVMASRNAILSFVLPHRGWFLLWMQRMFKRKNLNLDTMQWEEGSVHTMKRLTLDLMRLMKEEKTLNIFRLYNQLSPTLQDYERININREMINFFTFIGGALLANLLMGIRDDDDNQDSWLAQFMTYIGLRTVNEVLSQTNPFLEMNIIDMLQSPVVNARKLSDIISFSNWSNDAVENGIYAGETKYWRNLMKLSFGKQWYTIRTPESIRISSNYWLLNNKFSMFYLFPDMFSGDNVGNSIFDTTNY